MEKELLFSVTANDCRWDYFKGSGKGGQKRNKTSSGVRCTHNESGAVGQSDDTRSQHQNKRIAFQRMFEADKFKSWHRVEVAKHTGAIALAKERTDRAMSKRNLQVEVFNGKKWVDESLSQPQQGQ